MTAIKYRDYFNKATEQVFLLKILYLINIPLAKLFVYFRIKPHAITTLSNITALGAVISIFYNPYIFAFLWFLSLCFDICDGIVARITKQSSALGSFYDHFSDVIKIFSVYLAIGLYYNTLNIWILASLNISLFGLMVYVTMILTNRNRILSIMNHDQSNTHVQSMNTASKKNIIKRLINKSPKLKALLLFVYTSVFIIYGNFNLILIPLAFGENIAIYTFILLSIIVLKSLINRIRGMIHISKFMDTNNIAWK